VAGGWGVFWGNKVCRGWGGWGVSGSFAALRMTAKTKRQRHKGKEARASLAQAVRASLECPHLKIKIWGIRHKGEGRRERAKKVIIATFGVLDRFLGISE
jgi:hypothetical protein